jgi:uncharacterized protein YgiB involved in biofilm formation
MSSGTAASEGPASPKTKRSQTVSLVLLATAGAAAVSLGAVDPSQREEDVLVYPNPEACIAGRIRPESECRSEYEIARRAYPEAAPRYSTRSDCEAHHGPGHCLSGETVSSTARGRHVPVMAGYLIGRSAAQGLTPQPVYDHAPNKAVQAHSGTTSGGYCTSSGSRITTSSGGSSSSARVSSVAVRPAAFGGFGNTGRSFFSHGS